MKSAHQVFLLLLGLALASCAQPATNFSQFPGFAAYFATHPARHVPPTPDEQRLLERHRPRFFLPPQHAGLIDFYGDYIASGKLYAVDGTLLADQVTPGVLNASKTEPRVYFVHRSAPARLTQPVVYGRIEHDVVDLAQFGQREFVFLTYNAVFRHSGLPASVTGWRAMVLAIFASLDDWHQLDHYTAATVVLDETLHPVALVLQQHNYTHTYVFGRDLVLPADGRVLIDVAIRSNELYPHVSHRATRRAVRFLSPAAMRYLLGFGARPTMAADDVTDGQNETVYTLGFLPRPMMPSTHSRGSWGSDVACQGAMVHRGPTTTSRQCSSHGASRYSSAFFAKETARSWGVLKPRMPERAIPSISSACRPRCSVPRSTGTEGLSAFASICRRAYNASSLRQADGRQTIFVVVMLPWPMCASLLQGASL